MVETSVAEGTASPELRSSGDAILRLEGISKQFPGTLALDNVNFDVRSGEVHVLFGENGAGKSTLIQIVAGVYRQSSGSMTLNGDTVSLSSVKHARELGVSAVFQEFSLVPELSVEDNLFLGSELTRGPLLDKVSLRRQARETLDRLGFALKANSIVLYLSRAEQQMVEIAKAFRTKPSIMIMPRRQCIRPTDTVSAAQTLHLPRASTALGLRTFTPWLLSPLRFSMPSQPCGFAPQRLRNKILQTLNMAFRAMHKATGPQGRSRTYKQRGNTLML